MTDSDQYRRSGVNIAAGDALVARIKPLMANADSCLSARGAARLPDAGGFAACVRPPQMTKPVFAACADGVGTKVALLAEHNMPETAGIDVVAMCVNDLLCVGVQPLFFLDYYACDKLDADFAERAIRGIVNGCQQAECALIGGETAEMPGVYAKDAFDLAGFASGVGEEQDLFRPDDIQAQDALIAIASAGPHSNGYSLIRRILQAAPPTDAAILNAILAPTRIYCRSIADLRQKVRVRGLAHITGGGIMQNLPRMLPPGKVANIEKPVLPPVFDYLQKSGNISDDEMLQVFNCGIGMVAAVQAKDVDATLASLRASGEECRVLGEVADDKTPDSEPGRVRITS